jgi:hypothetical protein
MGHKPFEVNPPNSKNTWALLRSVTASRRAVLRMNRSVYWNVILLSCENVAVRGIFGVKEEENYIMQSS